MKYVYTSLDIGTDSIKVVVCELHKNKLNLLAASRIKSKGIKKGLITNVEEARESLKQAFDEVETMLGIKIKEVIASVPSYFAEYSIVKGTIEINGEENIISGDDIVDVLEKSIGDKDFGTNMVVTIIPIDFTLDDGKVVTEPRGLKSKTLTSRSILVRTPKKNIYSVVTILKSIGIEVAALSLNNIGDIYALKGQNTQDKIGAIINIGYATTTVSLYNKDVLVKSSIIPMGSKEIDNDLAYMYKISKKEARQIKEKFALAHKRYASMNDFYEDDNIDKNTKISQYEASEIVMSRLEEILNLAKNEINVLTNRQMHYIIVTGGSSNMAHFEYVLQDVFGKNATVGNVKMTGIRDNRFSSAVGNIVYFINRLKLRGKSYTMISEDDSERLGSVRKNIFDGMNDTMLGKIFGHFFNDKED